MQEEFLASPADICIAGGAAYAGKTFSLLHDCTRFINHPQFRAVIFRRTTPEIRNPGGLWETSEEIFPLLGASGFSNSLEWRFPSGAKVKFAHLEYEKDVYGWLGAQIPYIGFDQLEKFTSRQFWYLFGRNRGIADIPKYIRCTCNPDPDSWLAKFIGWWIDHQTGYAIRKRSGIVRWFVRMNDSDKIEWGNSRKELQERFGADCQPTSASFIMGTVADNKIGIQKDPGYVGKLKALPMVDREQLLKGNWKVRPAAGMYFKRTYFEIVDAAPADIVSRCRYWDRAATEKREDNDPKATAGVRLSRDRIGIYYVEDVQRFFDSAYKVERSMVNCSKSDPAGTIVGYMQDPGSAGKGEAESTSRALSGVSIKFAPATGDKVVRAKPVSSQAEAGNIKLVRGPWNEDFISELEAFPEGKFSDQVDALSGAFEFVTSGLVNATNVGYSRPEFDADRLTAADF